MVIQYGWGPDDSPAIYYASNAVYAFHGFPVCYLEVVKLLCAYSFVIADDRLKYG